MKRQARKGRINTVHIGRDHLNDDVPELYDKARLSRPGMMGYAVLNEALVRGLKSIAEEGKNEQE